MVLLRHLQHHLLQAIVHNKPLPPSILDETSTFSAAERLNLYRQAFATRVAQTLRKCFPVLHNVLSPEDIASLHRTYGQACPPSTLLMELAAGLPVFIATHALSGSHPFLSDLAVLEWTVFRTAQVHIPPPDDLSWTQHLSEAQWISARFLFNPSLRLLQTDWGVHPLLSTACCPLRFRTHLRIVRKSQLSVQPIDAEEGYILKRLQEGECVGAIIEGIEGPSSHHLTRWFAEWAADGLITGIRTD